MELFRPFVIRGPCFLSFAKKTKTFFYILVDIYFSTIFDDLAILQEALYSLLMHLEIMDLPNFHYLP